ncbi:Lipoxygenase homology domain-containing protein 1 [Trichinella sp. T6]|nr:Lipoxygenase homology domain-containing protein 1 [Trichinella sp. T6]
MNGDVNQKFLTVENGRKQATSIEKKSLNYSTRTVFFHKDGDKYFQAVKIPVSKARYRTIEALLDDLSKKVPLHFGVRRLFTPKGRDEIKDIDQLKNYGNYICASNRKVHALKLRCQPGDALNRQAANKSKATDGRCSWEASSSTLVEDSAENHRQIKLHNEIIQPKIKQVDFILNCSPGRHYTMRFKMNNCLLSFDEILRNLSDAFQVGIAKLYTTKGSRIIRCEDILNGPHQLIACKKYERPTVKDAGKLPLINFGKTTKGVSNDKPKETVCHSSLPTLPITMDIHSRKENSDIAQTVLLEKSDELHRKDSARNLKSASTSDLCDQIHQELEQGSSLTKLSRKQDRNKECVYEIIVCTGNRWAADMDSDLYIILYGVDARSEKLWLKQSLNDPKFQQNQADFFEIWCPYVGELKKITVGHNETGYGIFALLYFIVITKHMSFKGGGIFIDRISITEPNIDGLYYTFPCSKWFDVCQVDGKIERQLKCAGYCALNSRLRQYEQKRDEYSSENQWKLYIKFNKISSTAENSPELHVFAYSSVGKSRSNYMQQRKLIKATSEEAIFFNEVGRIYKIRIEVDCHSPDSEDFAVYIESMELVQKCSGDRRHITCRSWCRLSESVNQKSSTLQLFREFPIVDLKSDLLPVYKYHGKITLGDMRGIESGRYFHCKLYGELGDSGIIYLDRNKAENGILEFQAECVSLGRLMCVMFSTFVNAQAEHLCEGFNVLQELYEKYNCSVTAGIVWLVNSVVIRESLHSPYQYIFTEGRILEKQFPGVLRKELILSDITGLSTKSSRIDNTETEAEEEMWKLLITSQEMTNFESIYGNCCLTVFGELGNSGPIVLAERDSKYRSNKTIVFQIGFKSVGKIFKVRLQMDAIEDHQVTWYLKKLKMKNIKNGDEFRINAESLLMQTEWNPRPIVEFAVAWPDIPPLPTIVYNILVENGKGTDRHQSMILSLNLFGVHGDTGRRFLLTSDPAQRHFQPGNKDTFEIETIYLGTIHEVVIEIAPGSRFKQWHLKTIEIVDPEGHAVYKFYSNEILTSSATVLILKNPTVQASNGLPANTVDENHD